MDSEFLAIKWLSKQLILSFISINASTNIWKCYNLESLVSSSWLCSAPLRSTIISILSWYISIFKEFDLRFSPTNWDNKLSDAEKAGNSSSVA
jgi:hypothetical protein